jgi:hypothetical protein
LRGVSAVKNALGRARSGVVRAVKAPSGLLEGARRRPRYTIAIAAGVLIGLAWIGWAIYVTTENGAAAGLGVLLSWPVLLGAVALIAAPFVLTAMLVQRHRDSSPAIAGAPVASDPPKPEAEKKPAAAENEPEPQAQPEGEEAESETEDPAASSA